MGRGAEPVGLDDFNMRCLFDYQRIGLDCREVSKVQNMRRRGARSDKCAGRTRAWGRAGRGVGLCAVGWTCFGRVRGFITLCDIYIYYLSL
jgi:hypothetical protein